MTLFYLSGLKSFYHFLLTLHQLLHSRKHRYLIFRLSFYAFSSNYLKKSWRNFIPNFFHPLPNHFMSFDVVMIKKVYWFCLKIWLSKEKNMYVSSFCSVLTWRRVHVKGYFKLNFIRWLELLLLLDETLRMGVKSMYMAVVSSPHYGLTSFFSRESTFWVFGRRKWLFGFR